MTRPGYPWDRKDRLSDAVSLETWVGELRYRHARGPANNQPVLQYALHAAKVVAEEAARNRVAVIHAASNHVNALPALLAARQLGIPFQYEMRGLWELSRVSREPEFMDSHSYMQGLTLEGLVARHADYVFVISEQLKRYVNEQFSVPEKSIGLLPNCIDPQAFQVPPQVDVQQFTIAYAGSLIEYEGLDTLLRAIAVLRDEGIPCKLNIAGDGEARSSLQVIVNELDLEGQVRFLGKLSPADALQVLAQAEIVCIPRKPYEVCKIVPPIKLVEALAMAKPVVVPDLPVFRDELGSDTPGLFFRSGDAMDLARVLKEALENPEEMRVLGLRARVYVEQHRSWEPHIRNVLDTMDRLTSKVNIG
jgi:glycosyltransferase involved in cell wall biosynthesis